MRNNSQSASGSPCYCIYHVAEILPIPDHNVPLSKPDLNLLRSYVEGIVIPNKTDDLKNRYIQEIKSIFSSSETELEFRRKGHLDLKNCFTATVHNTFKPTLKLNPTCKITNYNPKNNEIQLRYDHKTIKIKLETLTDCFQGPLIEYLNSDITEKKKKSSLTQYLNASCPEISERDVYHEMALSELNLKLRSVFLTNLSNSTGQINILHSLELKSSEDFLSNVLQCLCKKVKHVRGSSLSNKSASYFGSKLLLSLADRTPDGDARTITFWKGIKILIPTVVVFHEVSIHNDMASVIRFLADKVRLLRLPVNIVVFSSDLMAINRIETVCWGIPKSLLEIPTDLVSPHDNELTKIRKASFGVDTISLNKPISPPIQLTLEQTKDESSAHAIVSESLLRAILSTDQHEFNALWTIYQIFDNDPMDKLLRIGNLTEKSALEFSVHDVLSLKGKNLIELSGNNITGKIVPSYPIVEMNIAIMLAFSGTELRRNPVSKYTIFIEGFMKETEIEQMLRQNRSLRFHLRVSKSTDGLELYRSEISEQFEQEFPQEDSDISVRQERRLVDPESMYPRLTWSSQNGRESTESYLCSVDLGTFHEIVGHQTTALNADGYNLLLRRTATRNSYEVIGYHQPHSAELLLSEVTHRIEFINETFKVYKIDDRHNQSRLVERPIHQRNSLNSPTSSLRSMADSFSG